MVYLPPPSRQSLPREQLLGLARLPLGALAVVVAVRLLGEPAAAITAVAARQVPLPELVYVVAVTLYLSGALALLFGYRVAVVAFLVSAMTLGVAGVRYLA